MLSLHHRIRCPSCPPKVCYDIHANKVSRWHKGRHCCGWCACIHTPVQVRNWEARIDKLQPHHSYRSLVIPKPLTLCWRLPKVATCWLISYYKQRLKRKSSPMMPTDSVSNTQHGSANETEVKNDQKQTQQPLRPAMVLGRRRSDAEGKNEAESSNTRGSVSKGVVLSC